MEYKRIFLIVLDSLGVGEASDASKYNDEGANTLGHILDNTKLVLPTMTPMGFLDLVGKKKPLNPIGYYTRMHEVSNGKDTLTGHLEMMGVITKIAFKTYTDTGFPDDLIKKIEEFSGRTVIGNCDASGTEIIKKLGEEQIKTGALIVYTSADSVLQIAAHEEIIPLDELYKICEYVRKITMEEKWKVGRIIARPYIGTPGNFTRTGNRRDYALDPAGTTALDILKDNGLDVIGIGKIGDVFNNKGITKSTHTNDNMDGINKIKETINKDFHGLCFANLNDFDSKYGHRRDVLGYSLAISAFDYHLKDMLKNLKEDDLLLITADHGNDPTWRGTDHTRETVPLLIYSKNLKNQKRLNDRNSFSDIGQTILNNFNLKMEVGESFLNELEY